MENNVETFEKELNSIIEICDEKIKKYRALANEFEEIRGSALSLFNLNTQKPEFSLRGRIVLVWGVVFIYLFGLVCLGMFVEEPV
ncbi:MAG: hypothetical protein Q6352_002355 [Candidatus Freyrarchaeum guaymaensis]